VNTDREKLQNPDGKENMWRPDENKNGLIYEVDSIILSCISIILTAEGPSVLL
jgi:hypothetical protein